jgi:predicted TIM-barrel fold metal-dependent hydrolase
VYPDLSGSGVDRGMVDAVIRLLGARRVLWACDLTMETGLAKLRALDHVGLTLDELRDIRWRNAARLFPRGAFPRCTEAGAMQ